MTFCATDLSICMYVLNGFAYSCQTFESLKTSCSCILQRIVETPCESWILRGTNGSFHVSTLATLKNYQHKCFILDPKKQGQISWTARDTSIHTVILKLLSNMQQKYVFCLKLATKKTWIAITVLYILCACIDTPQKQDPLPQSGMHDVIATSNNHQQKDRQFAMLVWIWALWNIDILLNKFSKKAVCQAKTLTHKVCWVGSSEVLTFSIKQTRSRPKINTPKTSSTTYTINTCTKQNISKNMTIRSATRFFSSDCQKVSAVLSSLPWFFRLFPPDPPVLKKSWNVHYFNSANGIEIDWGICFISLTKRLSLHASRVGICF